MAMVIKVRFKRASKLYDFDPAGLDLHNGMFVVTETARGVELGECMSGVMEVSDERVAAPLKPIMRVATEQDMLTQKRNEEYEKEAFDIAIERIAEHNLEMKLVDVEYAFDHSKIIFYFTANGRVDFRLLVKNLASIFKTRIELRQIGVRDEAKMLGGIGPCGRPICCRTFLSDFTPVSIKMAKEQNLSLNPTKISGLCDRLMCCLKYEQDQYEVTRKRMPRVGREIITPDGVGTINAINVLEETVRVRIAVGDTFELREYPIDDCQRLDQQSAPAAEKAEKPEQAERREKVEKTEKGEHHEKAEKAERRERPERPAKGERSEKPEKAEKPDKGDKPERGPKPKRQDRGERPMKPELNEQQGEKAHKPYPEKRTKPQKNAERNSTQPTEASQQPIKPAEADTLEIVEETEMEDLL
ncbi:MAG: hypothetical protein IJD60_11600 [Clostridia bacterium]|nr:hypothetical protein [Clostridia bacterium]